MPNCLVFGMFRQIVVSVDHYLKLMFDQKSVGFLEQKGDLKASLKNSAAKSIHKTSSIARFMILLLKLE
jgi:hypothetical protein